MLLSKMLMRCCQQPAVFFLSCRLCVWGRTMCCGCGMVLFGWFSVLYLFLYQSSYISGWGPAHTLFRNAEKNNVITFFFFLSKNVALSYSHIYSKIFWRRLPTGKKPPMHYRTVNITEAKPERKSYSFKNFLFYKISFDIFWLSILLLWLWVQDFYK